MAIDVYSPCPCGSGQKFKWCCQPIYQDIERAFEQENQGQHETALKIMDEAAAKHPDNPEIWGRKAQLLYALEKVEESEQALEKAFALNPNYPFGHLLRGMFRQSEGELPGALILFRRAAELYDPGAHDTLAQLYMSIAECELKMQRPVAARAAMQLAIHNAPADEDLHKAMDTIFGEQSRLPTLARKEYKLRGAAGDVRPEARAAWENAVRDRDKVRLGDLPVVFERITAENPADAPAWFNLGVARAWLGDNRRAVEALERSVRDEPDEQAAAEAWALAQVLSCSPGMEERTDYLYHTVLLQIRNPQAVVPMLEKFGADQRLLLFQTDEDRRIISGLITEKPPILAGGAGHASPLQAYILIGGGMVRLWHTREDPVNRLRQEMQHLFPEVLDHDFKAFTITAGFNDILAEAIVFPVGRMSEDEMKKRLHERVEHFFEEVWIQRPLLALDHVTPVSAVGDRTLRKKLHGVIMFLHDCSALVGDTYDFERLRRKLGLEQAATAAGSGVLDISAMGAAELAALKTDALSDADLEQAYRTAAALDAEELAENFARNLAARPVTVEVDRLPIYSFLVQKATREQRLDEALDWLEQGERFDCEHNEGRRRNDYELRRAQLHVKRKEVDQAGDVFDRLIERVPADLRVRAAAAEGMLTLRQGARAIRSAEQGLAKAREANDGDSERHFQELLNAARKLG